MSGGPSATGDSYRLERFVEAQRNVYDRACSELRAGQKRSHWMWFIFPQIRGLGASEMAVRFAVSGLDEARAYLAHDLLGTRLREITQIVLGVEGRTIDKIFGYPDDLKFHSSMTLFARAEDNGGVFGEALTQYFGGAMDKATLARI